MSRSSPLSRRAALSGALLLAGGAPREARAEGERSTAAACARGTSALRAIACELSRALGAGPEGAQARRAGVAVASGPLDGAPAGSSPDALPTRLAEAVARALSGAGPDQPARPLTGAPSLAAARAGAGASAPLLYLRPALVGGEVHVAASLHVPGRTIWDRVKTPSPGPRWRAEARRPLDAEVQGHLGAVPLAALTVTSRVAHRMPDVVAVACGAAGREAHSGEATLPVEITLVGRQRIVVGKVQAARWVPRAETAWTTLSPIAPSPLREPIASASVVPGVGLLVGSSDRARGALLSWSLTAERSLDPPVPWPGVGCLGRSGVGLGSPGPCPGAPAEEGPRVDAASVPATVDAIAGALLSDRAGELRAVIAAREPSGVARLRDSRGHAAEIPRVGAALSVGDADRDGHPEIAASEAVREARDDAVVIRTWSPDASGEVVTERLRLAVPDGVRALAICPPDAPGPSAWVVATPKELWIVR